jgi:transcriptional regulator
MYIPSANREDNPSELRRFMRESPLCALVSLSSRGLVATHLPVVLHESDSAFGVLRCHVARGNSQWRDLDDKVEALAIFTGPHHFISASWYPGKKTHGREVPTWNYIAVHAYGHLRAIEDPDWILEHVRSLTDQQEAIAQAPWKVSDAPPEFIAKMTRAIVGLELQINHVEGRWKASQNRTEEDALAVMLELDRLGTPESAAMRDLIRERRPQGKPEALPYEDHNK